jgi:hypothetical protein
MMRSRRLFPEMLDVGDERVVMGVHVCAEKARFVCYWVCHLLWSRFELS